MARRIVIEFLGKDAGLGRTSDKLGRDTDTLGSKLKRVGKVAAVALAGGAVIAGKALFDMGQKAGDLNETVSKTNAIFGARAAKSLESWSKGAAKSMGQSQQTALDAAATFGVFGKSAGKTGMELAAFAKQNTQLAADLASFHNTSPEEAITALGAAFRGEAEPMRRFGVLLDDASMREEALRLGLVKTTKEALTPQQKVLAAQALIMKQTTDAQGDFAKTSGGLANQQRILKAQLENVQVAIGQKVLPVMLSMATFANDKLLPALESLWGLFQRELLPALESFGDAAAEVAGFLLDHKGAVIALTAALVGLVAITKIHAAVLAVQAAGGLVAFLKQTKLVTAATKVWAAVQWAMNTALTANPIGIVVVALAALAAAAVVAYRKSDTFRKIVDTALRAIGKAGSWMWNSALKPAFSAMGKAIEALGKVGRWLWNSVFQPVFRFIVSGIGKLLTHWGGLLRALGKVPGFGWAESAGRKMEDAGRKADGLARSIRDIPERKEVRVDIVRTTFERKLKGDSYAVGNNARGTDYWRGGLTWVGEEGPEIVDLPRGTRIIDARKSARMVSAITREVAAGGTAAGGVVGHAVVDLRLDGRVVQRVLLKLKRTTGEELGLA